MKRAMAIVMFLVLMAFIMRAPGQSLGDVVGQVPSSVGTFLSRVVTMEQRP